MSKKDYTKFSKSQNVVRDDSNHEIVSEVVYPLPEDDIPEEPVIAPVQVQKPLIFGKVVGCSRLNVRQSPTLFSDVLCCLTENTEIEIDEGKSTNEFYAICTPAGLEGFCLKKFIEIRK